MKNFQAHQCLKWYDDHSMKFTQRKYYFFCKIVIFCCLFIKLANSGNIYAPPTYFRSYNIMVQAALTNGSPQDYVVITPVIHQNIIRCGISLAQFYKSYNDQLSFSASVTASASNTDNFTISVIVNNPVVMGVRYFLIVIMDQPTIQMIDLNILCISASSGLNYDTVNVQSIDIFTDIRSPTTIFTAASNLHPIAFLTSFISTVSAPSTYLNNVIVDATIKNSSHLKYTFTSGPFTAVQQVCIVVVIYSNLALATLMGNSQPINKLDYSATMTIPFSKLLQFSAWGPDFDRKCILGLSAFAYFYDDNYFPQLILDSSGKYSTYDVQTGGTLNVAFIYLHFFCLGYGLDQCSSDSDFRDLLTNQCHTNITCPVTPYGSYITNKICPNCSDASCQTCNISNRSICYSCFNYTYKQIINNQCVCIGAYVNNTNGSEICQANCSYYIQGCDQTSCTSMYNCTACQASSEYYLQPDAFSNSICIRCNVSILGCLTCSTNTTCLTCEIGYYKQSSLCYSCNSNITYCLQCYKMAGDLVCSKCQDGYISTLLVTGNYQCLCTQTYFLHNCTQCTNAHICDMCIANFFPTLIGNLTDCSQCKNLIPHCSTCNDNDTCMICDSLYFLYYNSSSSGTTCEACGFIIPYCVNCNNQTSCAACQTNYGVDGNSMCTLCNSSMPGCQFCLQYTTCQQCYTGYALVGSQCQSCNSIFFGCIQCHSDPSGPFCDVCITGYYSHRGVCFKCSDAMPNCQQCSNRTECQVCASPFIFDVNITCNNCSVGTYVTQTFSNVTGCSTSRVINGVTVCIGCDFNNHFILNFTTKQCVCDQNYKLINDSCLYICGYNLVTNMQCNDGNSNNGDGCDQYCQIQPGFYCTTTSNIFSNCILTQDFSITLNYIKRNMGQNSALLSFTVIPASTALQNVDWKSVVTFNFSGSVGLSYTYHNGQLLVKVDYSSSIDAENIVMNVNFNPNSIISKSNSLNFKMIGINGPLTYQSNLSDYKNFTIMSWIIVVFLMMQFVIANYYHKMIGLQTLQCIQTIYFIRMIVTDKSNSSIYGLNGLKYSNGFNDITSTRTSINSLKEIPSVFAKLDLSLQFLQNVNTMLVPILLAGAVYFVYKVKLLYNKFYFLQTESKEYKDVYTILNRSSIWFYQHFIFTYSMALMFILTFSTILKTISNTSSTFSEGSLFEKVNFMTNQYVYLIIMTILSFEVISGIQSYFKSGKSSFSNQQQLLDYDQNKNYSCSQLYVPIYLIYYLCLMFLITSVISQFQYVVEIATLIVCLYLVLICFWRPYVQTLHNGGIIFNQSVVAIFSCMILLAKYVQISSVTYSVMFYLIIICLFVINFIAIVRIYKEWSILKNEKKSKRANNIEQKNKNIEQMLKKNPYIYNSQNRQIFYQEYNKLNQVQKCQPMKNIAKKFQSTNKSQIQKEQKRNQDINQKYNQNNNFNSLRQIKKRLKNQYNQFIKEEDQ